MNYLLDLIATRHFIAQLSQLEQTPDVQAEITALCTHAKHLEKVLKYI